MKRILIAALAVATLAAPAQAGRRHHGHYGYGAPPWGCSAPGACRLPGPGAYGAYGRLPSYGYYGGNGYVPPYGAYGHVGGQLAPPPPSSVPVEPAYCERHDLIFDSRLNNWRCRPVKVPRLQ